ncbi:MAG TPA: DUF5686 family protein [Puia sp.]|nr:DUF5686 family protein [Puia sp.]
MRVISQIILFFLAGLLSETGFGQTRTITGIVLDSASRTIISNVSVFVKNGRHGVISNAEGNFSIRVDNHVSQLVISAEGYEPQSVSLPDNLPNPLTILLSRAFTTLREFVVTGKPGKYRNRHNPAVELIRRVIANKEQNGPLAPAYTSYQEYEKVRLLLDRIPRVIADDKVLKKYHFLFENRDTSLMPGRPLVPVYIEEVLSDNYCRKRPEKSRKIVLGRKAVDFGEYIDMRGISQFINRLYENINIYDNRIDLFTTQFISPIADAAPAFYMFFIRDTTHVDGQRIVRLYFTPRNPADLLFRGYLSVNIDNNYAVTRVELGVSQLINLNFVREFQVKQDFEKGDAGHYHLVTSDVIALFNAIPGTLGMVGERIVRLDQITDSALPDQVFKGPDVDTVSQARGSADTVFNARPIPLTSSEVRTYANTDSLVKMRSYRRLVDYATAFTAGYKSAGKVDIGPIGSFWTFNQIEGQRLRFGARTNTRLSQRYYGESYIAYGFRDRRWKYFVSASYALNNKSVYTYPLHYIQVSWLDDTRRLGAENAFSQANNFFTSFTHGDNSKWLYNHIGRFSYVHEYSNHFSYSVGMKYWQQRPAGSLYYVYEPSGEPDSVQAITTGEVSLTLRWAPHEEFFQNKAARADVVNRWPILTAQFAKGISGLFGGRYDYDAYHFNVYKRFYIAPIGFSDVTLDAGFLRGELPYPLLTIAPGNQSYFYYETIYNLMNIGEFASDHYAGIDIDHFFGGFFFNKVPGLKRLKLREVVGAKVLYGGLRDENNPAINFAQMKFPASNGVTNTYPLTSRPYIEASVGIYNILTFLRLDLVKRFTYLDHPNVSQLGLRISTSFNF